MKWASVLYMSLRVITRGGTVCFDGTVRPIYFGAPVTLEADMDEPVLVNLILLLNTEPQEYLTDEPRFNFKRSADIPDMSVLSMLNGATVICLSMMTYAQLLQLLAVTTLLRGFSPAVFALHEALFDYIIWREYFDVPAVSIIDQPGVRDNVISGNPAVS